MEHDGKFRIHTTWLLTQTTDYSDIWQSTNIGVDIFRPLDEESKDIPAIGVLRQSNLPKKLLEKQKE